MYLTGIGKSNFSENHCLVPYWREMSQVEISEKDIEEFT